EAASPAPAGRGENRFDNKPLPPPTDVTSRTEYPRPWLGGTWKLRDIVDYELIATMALLETAADRRETILRQIYDVNRETIDKGRTGDLKAIVVPVDGQQDPREAAHLVDRLRVGGVDVFRADAPFDADGKRYAPGTYVIPMAQVFARYADLSRSAARSECTARAALRRHRVVARNAPRRQDILRQERGLVGGENDRRNRTGPDAGRSCRQRAALRVRRQRAGHCHRPQSPPETRRARRVRVAVAR